MFEMNVQMCEILSVVLFAILPVVIIGALVYHYDQPLENGIMAVALMIFVALLILWIVSRSNCGRARNTDKDALIDDPDVWVVEIDTKSPSFPKDAPIFTPIITNLPRLAPVFKPNTSVPVPTHGQTPSYSEEVVPSSIYVVSGDTRMDSVAPSCGTLTGGRFLPSTQVNLANGHSLT